jgi:hypothetical protein
LFRFKLVQVHISVSFEIYSSLEKKMVQFLVLELLSTR